MERDLPGVPNGKELAKFRTGCGITHTTNMMGEIVVSALVEAGPGLAILPGCGDGDPIILSADLSDVTSSLDVETDANAGDGASPTVEFRAPRQPGVHDDVCRLHGKMMRGQLTVR